MATEETKAADEAKKVVDAAKEAEAPEAPAEVEAGASVLMPALYLWEVGSPTPYFRTSKLLRFGTERLPPASVAMTVAR
jgi:hypothetical protein